MNSQSTEPSTHSCITCECDVCVRGIHKGFAGVGAVNGVSFELAKGQLTALLGPSGCGKTTTLRLIAGFEQLDAGEIEISQQLVAAQGLHLPPEKRRIGMVFQEYALFPHLTVAENVRFGLHDYAKNKNPRVAEVLDLVGLTDLGTRMPNELSGGQQQRVALARALAPEPHLILLDEPFSNLDASLRTRVRAEVRAILRAAEATALFVTHDQEEALSMVDQVVVMMDGKVAQIAQPHQLYYQPANTEVAAFVGEANFVPGHCDGYKIESTLGTLESMVSNRGEVNVMIRPESIEVRPTSATTDADATYRVRDIAFFGHDQLLTVETAAGKRLDARIFGLQHHFSIGQPVSLKVSGPVMTYPVANYTIS